MAGPPAPRRQGLREPAPRRLVWRGGDPRYAERLEPVVRSLLGTGEGVEILREKPGRRRLARAVLASGEACFLKHLPEQPGLLGAAKERLGLTPAAREFRMLLRLARAGVPVPEPLAWFAGPAGDEVLVTRFLEGRSLGAALAREARARRRLLAQVGALVARLHAARVSHRDLHRENVWVTESGPVLIDLQQAIPISTAWLRQRDLGELDASVAPLLSLADRMRLRTAALGIDRRFGAAARAALRSVGRASEARQRAHVESRTRRSLREGRLYARLRCAEGRGMRLRSASEALLHRALAGGGAPGQRVRRFHSAGGWRSTPARRAWLAGHGLRARGIGAELPLAFVEGGLLLRRSAVVLEAGDPKPNPALHELVALGVALQRHRVEIPSDAFLCRDARGELGPSALESVRFPRRLVSVAARRIDQLVERAVREAPAGEDDRAAALRRYAARCAFYGIATSVPTGRVAGGGPSARPP